MTHECSSSNGLIVEQMATLQLVSRIDGASHWNDVALINITPEHIVIHWRPFLYDEHHYFHIQDGIVHMIPRPINEIVDDGESFQLIVKVQFTEVGWDELWIESMYLTLHGLNADHYMVGTIGKSLPEPVAHPITTRRCRLSNHGNKQPDQRTIPPANQDTVDSEP